MKYLIFSSFYIGMMCGLERTDVSQFPLWAGCGGLARTNFKQFLLWEGVVDLEELNFNSFYIRRVWRSRKN